MPLAGPKLLYWRPSAAPIPRALYAYMAPASFVETGFGANLFGVRTLVANGGAFTATGNAVTLARGQVMPAATGNFISAGVDATLTILRTLVAVPAVYTLAVRTSNLTADTPMASVAGAYTLTGTAANLVYGARGIVASSVTFTLTGIGVNFNVSGSRTVRITWDNMSDDSYNVGYDSVTHAADDRNDVSIYPNSINTTGTSDGGGHLYYDLAGVTGTVYFSVLGIKTVSGELLYSPWGTEAHDP